MKLPDFRLAQPASLSEAHAAAVEAGDGNFDWLGGGTDLLCNYKWGINSRRVVISLRTASRMGVVLQLPCSPTVATTRLSRR